LFNFSLLTQRQTMTIKLSTLRLISSFVVIIIIIIVHSDYTDSRLHDIITLLRHSVTITVRYETDQKLCRRCLERVDRGKRCENRTTWLSVQQLCQRGLPHDINRPITLSNQTAVYRDAYHADDR